MQVQLPNVIAPKPTNTHPPVHAFLPSVSSQEVRIQKSEPKIARNYVKTGTMQALSKQPLKVRVTTDPHGAQKWGPHHQMCCGLSCFESCLWNETSLLRPPSVL